MNEKTYLYLLIFPEKGVMKIGKANNILDRIITLRRYWGNVDYNNSYQLYAHTKIVFKLEKSLHFLLSEYSVEYEYGDGRTELFSLEALDDTIKYINIFLSSKSNLMSLEKGIVEPQPSNKKKTKSKRKFLKFRRTTREITEKLIEQAVNFERINRILLILLRRQNRISYQYDIIEGNVYFRLTLAERNNSFYRKITQLFYIDFEDFEMYLGGHRCSTCSEGNVIQFNIESPKNESNFAHPLLVYFHNQNLVLLKNLPLRSPDLSEDIPILDRYKIINDILNKISVENTIGIES